MEERVARRASVVVWFTLLALPVLSGCAPGLASSGEPDAAIEADDAGSPSLVVQPIAEAGPADDAAPDAREDGEDSAMDGPCDGATDSLGGRDAADGEDADAGDAPPALDGSQGLAAEASVDASDDVPPGPPMQPSCASGIVCGNACVDLQSDPHDCGACGHVCTPGTCASGACQPWVVVSGVDPAAIACDGVNLVWANAATPDVHQVPADGSANGGGASTITLSRPGADSAVALAMAGSAVAWATVNYSRQQSTLWVGSEGAVYSGVAVGAPLDPVAGLALDPYGAYAYLGTASGTTGTIWQCNMAGASTSCVSIASVSSSRLGQLAVDDQYVYWTDPANALVSRLGHADHIVADVATGQGNPTAIALDAANVYWLSGNGAAFSIRGTPKQLAAAPTVLATSPGYATALATDGASLYVATYGGVIESVPVTGGSLATRYASANANTSAITQVVYTGGAIYWGDRGPQAIYGLRVR